MSVIGKIEIKEQIPLQSIIEILIETTAELFGISQKPP